MGGPERLGHRTHVRRRHELPAARAILQFVNDDEPSAPRLASALDKLDRQIAPAHRGLMMNLLGSHDTRRVMTACHDDVDAVRLAFAILFTAEGAPMVYYGDEVGMTGFDDDACRGTMDWTRETWNTELLAWVRRLGECRRKLAPLRRGTAETLHANGHTIVRLRSLGSQQVAAAFNAGREDDVVPAGILCDSPWRDHLTGETFGTEIPMAPRQARILSPTRPTDD